MKKRRFGAKLAIFALASLVAVWWARPPWVYQVVYAREISDIEEAFSFVESEITAETCPSRRHELEMALQDAYRHAYIECESDGYRVGLTTGFDDVIYLRRRGDELCWWFDECK